MTEKKCPNCKGRVGGSPTKKFCKMACHLEYSKSPEYRKYLSDQQKIHGFGHRYPRKK